MFVASERWRETYPGAIVGVLAMHNLTNPERHHVLDEHKELLEAELRTRYAGLDRSALKALPVIQAYTAYYKRFDKSYHVLLQLESVVWKGKSIPRVAGLVEAMFMAELDDLLLTAGHDLQAVQPPVTIDVARGQERFERLSGDPQQLKAGDMFIADALGVISSVLHGPDLRTRIRPETHSALYTTYAPPGIEAGAVLHHLDAIQANVRIFAPGAQVAHLALYGADQAEALGRCRTGPRLPDQAGTGSTAQ